MVNVKEIGVFKYNSKSDQYCKTDFDYKKENRELWLVEVIPVSLNSNYGINHEIIARYIFRINSGLNKGKSYIASEDYLVVFEICNNWHKSEETILLELREAFFDKYPIIDCQSVLDMCIFIKKNW